MLNPLWDASWWHNIRRLKKNKIIIGVSDNIIKLKYKYVYEEEERNGRTWCEK
jgi:hypothetical protein